MLKLLLTVALLMAMTFNSLPDAAAQNRREMVDLLVLGGTIVTMDQTRRIIDDGGVNVSVSATTASSVNCRSPSDNAFQIATRSAHTVKP